MEASGLVMTGLTSGSYTDSFRPRERNSGILNLVLS